MLRTQDTVGYCILSLHWSCSRGPAEKAWFGNLWSVFSLPCCKRSHSNLKSQSSANLETSWGWVRMIRFFQFCVQYDRKRLQKRTSILSTLTHDSHTFCPIISRPDWKRRMKLNVLKSMKMSYASPLKGDQRQEHPN